ncbi:hypothetical protein ACIRPT_39845 [Streptomyces sp. NPDC101227]|uniref:hypothetical protein n=1 Tax=Streptomyces sp. NPDC101227 TaxID=3366136 RepID=UPI0038170B9A
MHGDKGYDYRHLRQWQWQHDGAPMQLHPGDIGWNYQFGTAETAAVVQTPSRHRQPGQASPPTNNH